MNFLKMSKIDTQTEMSSSGIFNYYPAENLTVLSCTTHILEKNNPIQCLKEAIHFKEERSTPLCQNYGA